MTDKITKKTSDSLTNVVSKMGTSGDKASHSFYGQVYLSPEELISAYRGSGFPKKIVDIPANDACSEWREWQAQASDISKIEAEEKRLGLKAKIRQALIWSRLFGGAAILIGTGDANPSEPLNPERISVGGVKYLTVLTKDQITPGEIETNPALEGYNEPRVYTINGSTSGGVTIHPSRLVILNGVQIPSSSGKGGWGDSALQSVITSLKHLDGTTANVASLVFESKVDIIKIPSLIKSLQRGGPEAEQNCLKRGRLIAMGKGINSVVLMDKDEEYQQKTANFANLPAIMDRFMQLVAGAADIPATRLFGQSPAGLNSTGEGDEKNYYKSIRSLQTLTIEPAMVTLDTCLVWSALGRHPKELHYNWRPLNPPTAHQKAETADKLMSALDKLASLDVIDDDSLSEVAVNALTQCGAFPGLEAAVNKYHTTE